MEAYKVRMIKEYQELLIRTVKLGDMLAKYHKGELDFEPTCSFSLLMAQYSTMRAYMNILEERASLEGVDLNEVINN